MIVLFCLWLSANRFVGYLLGLANQVTYMPYHIYYDRNLPFGREGKLNILTFAKTVTRIECKSTHNPMSMYNMNPRVPMTGTGLNVLKHNPMTEHGLTVLKHNPLTEHGLNVLKHNPMTEDGLNVVKHNPIIEDGLTVVKHNPMTDHGLTVVKHNPMARYDKNPWIQRHIHH